MRIVKPMAQERDRRIARVLWIVLALNWLVAAAKLFVGWRTGALSLLTDGLHSVLDGASNVVGLIGISIASRPPDRQHPYGHRRFETMAAVIIGLLIGAGFLEIISQLHAGVSGERAAANVSWGAAAVVIVTVVSNAFISAYESRQARLLRSALLEADSKHTASDALAAIAVLAGFAGCALGWPDADLVAAAIVSVFIAHTAWSILRANIAVLADEACLSPEEVHATVVGVAGVRGAHKIRSRGDPDHVHLDLHLHLDPNMPLHEAHALSHVVAAELRRQFPQLSDVVVHTEPADGREKDRSKLVPGG